LIGFRSAAVLPVAITPRFSLITWNAVELVKLMRQRSETAELFMTSMG